MDDFTEQSEEIVTLIRSQNWKNGGVLAIDHCEAVALVNQAMRAAYTKGAAESAKETGDSMLRAFDDTQTKMVGGPQTEAVKRFSKSGA